MSALQSYNAFPTGGGSLSATAQNGASMVLLSTITASNSATVSFESNINSTYDMYQIIAENIYPSTGPVSLYVQLKIAGAYQTSGYYFRGYSSANYAESSVAQLNIANGSFNQTVTDNSGTMIMYIPFPAATTNLKSIITSTYPTGVSGYPTTGVGTTSSGTGALTGVKIYFSSGNISTGTFRLYGIKNS
jgi:hypothetical protein